jgi:protein TonB
MESATTITLSNTTLSRNFIISFCAVITFHISILATKLIDKSQTFEHGPKTSRMAVRLQVMDNKKVIVSPKTKPLKNKINKKSVVTEKKEISTEKIVSQDREQIKKEVTPKNVDSIITNYVKPSYPRIALRRGITGEVVLALWVKGNGTLEKLIVETSSGNNSLDHSALVAAKTWKFKQISNNFSKVFKFKKRIVYSIN